MKAKKIVAGVSAAALAAFALPFAAAADEPEGYVSFTAVRVMAVIGIVLLLLGLWLLRRGYRREVRGSGLRRAADLPDVP